MLPRLDDFQPGDLPILLAICTLTGIIAACVIARHLSRRRVNQQLAGTLERSRRAGSGE